MENAVEAVKEVKPRRRVAKDMGLVAPTIAPAASNVEKGMQTHNPDFLLSQAIVAGASIDTLERLMTLREKMVAESSRNAFNAALSNFQAECPVIQKKKSAKDDKGKKLYSYAPLEQMIPEVAPLLQKHGFTYSWKTKQTPDSITVVCIGTHNLGHSEQSEFEVSSKGGTSIMSAPQKAAAALTFAKRYTFVNLFGIVTGDEDVDAAKSVVGGTDEDMATDAQKSEIDELTASRGLTKQQVAQMVRLHYNVSITEVTAKQAQAIINGLKKRPEQQA